MMRQCRKMFVMSFMCKLYSWLYCVHYTHVCITKITANERMAVSHVQMSGILCDTQRRISTRGEWVLNNKKELFKHK